MNDLRDTRKLVGRTVTDELGIKGRYAMAAQEAVYELLAGNPGVELATIRFRVDAEHPPKVTVTGRVGSLVGPAGDPGELTYVSGTCHGPGCGRDYDQPPTNACPTPGVHDDPRPDPDPSIPLGAECSSCHQLPGRPPTDYCRRPDLHNVNEDDPNDQPRPKMPCGCDGAATEHDCRLRAEYALPAHWQEHTGIKIVDPDGWDRRNFLESWNTPITLEEFHRRALNSTTRPL